MEEKPQQLMDIELLNTAMEAFNSAASNLQTSYDALKEETKRLRDEVELKNVELSYFSNLLESVLNNTPSAILVVNERAEFAVKNSAADALLADMGEKALKDMLAGSLHQGLFEYNADGGRYYRINAGELHSDGLNGVVYVVDDITLLKKFELERQRGIQLQLMGEMAANIAHEIRNPLGSIELFASLLERDLQSSAPSAVKMTSNIVQAVRTLNSIISNTLLFTKEINVNKEEFILADIVDEAVLYLQPLLMKKDVAVLNRLEETHKVFCERGLFYQVVMNILHNAIDAVPDKGGEVEITSEMGAFQRYPLKLSITDNGCGIAPAMQDKLFIPFQTTKTKGAGLGLSIAYKIVKAHGGDIIVDSDGTSYTRFTVIL
ncbi:MAG: two-component sensor histidine kinase [Deferribacteraceae bacterium]|jgi:two-component system sensor histidine kinase FlrB|nr:two-component sensor histidine kinase [Deferribacteraceae bacterium]